MGESEVLVGQRRRLAAAGRAFEEALLDQERLVDLLDRPGVFAHGGGDRIQPDGAAADTRTTQKRESLRFLIRQLLVLYPKSTVCGHRDLSPDLNGNGVIEPQEWLKQCPCFDASTEYAPLCAEAFHRNG